jgi:hypothetical protein
MSGIRAVAGVVLLCALCGCADMRAADRENLLTLAGFQRVATTASGAPADLPPRELVQGSGGNWYFADPEGCACVFVGGFREYAAYEDLRRRQILAIVNAVNGPSGASQ